VDLLPCHSDSRLGLLHCVLVVVCLSGDMRASRAERTGAGHAGDDSPRVWPIRPGNVLPDVYFVRLMASPLRSHGEAVNASPPSILHDRPGGGPQNVQCLWNGHGSGLRGVSAMGAGGARIRHPVRHALTQRPRPTHFDATPSRRIHETRTRSGSGGQRQPMARPANSLGARSCVHLQHDEQEHPSQDDLGEDHRP